MLAVEALLRSCCFFYLLINGESLTDMIIKDSLPFSSYYFPSPAPFIPQKKYFKNKNLNVKKYIFYQILSTGDIEVGPLIVFTYA